MLNFYRLDYIPSEIDEDVTCYNTCKYWIKRMCPGLTLLTNLLFFLLNIYITLPAITHYFNDGLVGYLFFIAIESVFIIISGLLCWYII